MKSHPAAPCVAASPPLPLERKAAPLGRVGEAIDIRAVWPWAKCVKMLILAQLICHGVANGVEEVLEGGVLALVDTATKEFVLLHLTGDVLHPVACVLMHGVEPE